MGDSNFARYFDAQYRSFKDDIPLWLYLANEYGAPILELGCGTGRVLQALIEAGHRSVGIDHDQQMLVRAKMQLAPFFIDNPCLVQADLQTFAFGLRFNLAIAPMNTLCTFDDTSLIGVFCHVRRQLAPGGLIAFEIPNPEVDPFEGVDPDEPLTGFIESESGNPCQVYAQRVEQPTKNRVKTLWHFDELLADGSSQRYTLRQDYFLRSTKEIQNLLGQANYKVTDIFGDYARTPFREDSETMIIVARANLR